MPKTILNYTPHEINVRRVDAQPVKPLRIVTEGDQESMISSTLLVSFPSVGIARVDSISPVDGFIEVDGYVIEVVKTTYGVITNLPEPRDDTFLIVSLIVAKAAMDSDRTTSDLLVPSDPVRDAEGRVIGCTRFARL